MKKRATSMLLALVLLISLFPLGTLQAKAVVTGNEDSFILGDVNGDQKVNPVDLIVLRRHLAGGDRKSVV